MICICIIYFFSFNYDHQYYCKSLSFQALDSVAIIAIILLLQVSEGIDFSDENARVVVSFTVCSVSYCVLLGFENPIIHIKSSWFLLLRSCGTTVLEQNKNLTCFSDPISVCQVH